MELRCCLALLNYVPVSNFFITSDQKQTGVALLPRWQVIKAGRHHTELGISGIKCHVLNTAQPLYTTSCPL